MNDGVSTRGILTHPPEPPCPSSSVLEGMLAGFLVRLGSARGHNADLAPEGSDLCLFGGSPMDWSGALFHLPWECLRAGAASWVVFVKSIWRQMSQLQLPGQRDDG